MKKILILSLISITSFTLMSFRGCQIRQISWKTFLEDSQEGNISIGDNSVMEYYGIYVGDNGVILRSSGDNNIIFEQKTSGTTERLNSLRVNTSLYNGVVFAVGNNGTIVRSTNTGNNWTVASPVTSANLYGIDHNTTECYAVGDNGTFLVSVTGGDVWTAWPCGTIRNLKAIAINPQFATRLIAVGEKGTIIRTTNNGLNWINVSLGDTTITFNDISRKNSYFNSSNVYIAGSGGKIYKSTDFGATWLQKPSGTTNNLTAIYFHTTDSAIVVGDNGTIRFTTNGGESWFTDPFFDSPSSRNYRSVSLVNLDNKTYTALSDSIFFVSQDPITLGFEQVNSEIPKQFTLLQNYPNPFNPSTKIRFDIPANVHDRSVQLRVYDISGKEVGTLVDQRMRPGTYEVDFDGSKYSSGVYFYKLTSDEFAETKRMILIK